MSRSKAYTAYLRNLFISLAICMGLILLILAPYSYWWLYQSGDSALDRAVQRQAGGEFVIFGSGISQDFVEYKLRLYEAIKPDIIAVGSSRVMQFRGAWFKRPFLNMGGAAGNLAVLRSIIEALLAIHPPRAAIIGIDFWWFLPQWEENPQKIIPPTSGTYNYGLESLKKPWEWLMEGKIGPGEFLLPITGVFGRGFRTDRFGIMAQQTADGFGPDGAWNYTAAVTGQKPAEDWQFKDTLLNISRGIKAFYHNRTDQPGPDPGHIQVFADIIAMLHKAKVRTYIFMPPLAGQILRHMPKDQYSHLFRLAHTLAEKGVDVFDLTDPALVHSGDCEFVDGFHGGEITYARLLQALTAHWPGLLNWVNMEKLDEIIERWGGNALVPDYRLTTRPEVDFLGLGCAKKTLSLSRR